VYLLIIFKLIITFILFFRYFVEVKTNLRTLDQWMVQMEVRLKPNYFRVNWNRRELRQKTEEHKVRRFKHYK